MSLLPFHRVLIAAAIVFCAGFAVWELVAFVERGRFTDLGLAVGFAVAAAVFGYYLRHLDRLLGLSSSESSGDAERRVD